MQHMRQEVNGRLERLSAVLLVAFLLLPASAQALEKRAVPFDGDRSDAWHSGGTCRISYYNICTGWVWCWSGFGDGGRIGTVFETCGDPQSSTVLLQSVHFACLEAPPGYGFTGTIAVYSVDANDCPVGAPIASQPFLPTTSPPFQAVAWGAVFVPSQFAIVVTMKDGVGGLANPAQMGTDHPAPGPTGPIACGTCYPINRPNHSYNYGNVNSPICPGSPFNDGVCSAELFWDADVFGEFLATQPSSWGAIKELYR